MLYSGLIIDNTYQVVEEIGAGGMGVVYLAFHLRLEKYVVLKKIKNVNANMALLRNEVDILKGLHHPYLPQVYDFIQHEDYLYTVIDYIDGYDLKKYIESGQVFTESQLIKWLRQICNVLEYLHNHTPQILHTDIKPANIIITGTGDICLIDFGISLYGSNQIKGVSKEYASPEQYHNVQCLSTGYGHNCVELDERVDIYSVAATFYHLMTGVTPSLLVQQPKISQYNTGYSESFVAIIDKCMETNRDDRYSKVSQIEKALDNMYKLDSGYKKYILLQLISSLLAGVMIVSGAVMVMKGLKTNLNKEYETAFNEFLYTQRIGNTEETIRQGYLLLNESKYNSIMDRNTRALIVHTIADEYYDIGDFYNAAYFYEQAIAQSENADDIQLYYRDYIFALINDGRISTAETVLAEFLEAYPDSGIGGLVDAQLAYKNRDYSRATQRLDSLIQVFSADPDNLYSVYMLYGDCCYAQRKFEQAMNHYTQVNKLKETENNLRKLGLATLRCANGSNNRQLYKSAQKTFGLIYNYYSPSVDDVFNYVQCYLLCGGSDNYNECIRILNSYISLYGEDCRVYILMAISADALNSPQTAEYCLKAKKLYNSLSSEEKELIDRESLNQIKALYRKHCGGVW